MLDQKDSNYGFDAQKGEYVRYAESGIVDRPRLYALPSRARRLSPAFSSPPKRWWPRSGEEDCRRSSGGMGGGMGDMDF